MTKVDQMYLKDLSFLLLAYYSKPNILTKEQIEVILKRIQTILLAKTWGRQESFVKDINVKTCQVLVYNFGLYAIAPNNLWLTLIKIYEQFFM